MVGDVELVPPDEPELGEVVVVELEPGVVESELDGVPVLEPVLDPLLSDVPVPDVPDVELLVPDDISLLEVPGEVEVPGEELPDVELSVPVVPELEPCVSVEPAPEESVPEVPVVPVVPVVELPLEESLVPP